PTTPYPSSCGHASASCPTSVRHRTNPFPSNPTTSPAVLAATNTPCAYSTCAVTRPDNGTTNRRPTDEGENVAPVLPSRAGPPPNVGQPGDVAGPADAAVETRTESSSATDSGERPSTRLRITVRNLDDPSVCSSARRTSLVFSEDDGDRRDAARH